MAVIIFIIILAILILVHEAGHFIVAKMFGIKVEKFALGFPPKIWSKKIGETEYSINAIPFGGFVKIFGEDPEETVITEEEKPHSLFYKPRYIQSAVFVAGIVFNIIFAWLIISFGFVLGLPTPVSSDHYGKVVNPEVVVVDVLSGSPAQKAGLTVGDKILSVEVNNTVLPDVTSEKISQATTNSTGDIVVSFENLDHTLKTVSITPSENIVAGRKAIGLAMDNIGILKLPVHLALLEGAQTTYYLTKDTIVGISSFLWSAITFHSDLSQVSGPIGIAGVVSKAKDLGFIYLLSLIALISINLAVINLIPFPALDGGRIFFAIIESIIRRPLPRNAVMWTNAMGFALLIILMIVISGHDILNLL